MEKGLEQRALRQTLGIQERKPEANREIASEVLL